MPKCTGTHPGKGAGRGAHTTAVGLPLLVSSRLFPMPYSDPMKRVCSGSGACVVENGPVGMATTF